MNKYLLFGKVIMWLTLAIYLAWLGVQAIVPGGQITYNYDFNQRDNFIGNLTPVDRLEPLANGTQKIIGNPIYFSLRTTRPFDRAVVKYRLKSQTHSGVIESGVLVDSKAWRYQMKPLSNTLLDSLIDSGNWGLIKKDNVILLQRQERYSSIDAFLANPPARHEIALYNYYLPQNLTLSDYRATSTPLVWSYPLRGGYQFYTYLDHETLDFQFSIADINENKDADGVELIIYDSANKIIKNYSLADDRLSDLRVLPESRVISVQLEGLATGLYKFEFKANSDIITKQIITKQNKLAFSDKIWLYQNNQKINFFASGNFLSFQTISPASKQVVKLGSQTVVLDQTYRQIKSSAPCGQSCSISLERGDVIVSGEAVFGLRADNLIDPRYRRLSSDYRDDGNVNFILAEYNRQIPDADKWQNISAEFDLKNAHRQNSSYGFMISLPALSSEDELDDYVEIDSISVELYGKNWFELISNFVKNL